MNCAAHLAATEITLLNFCPFKSKDRQSAGKNRVSIFLYKQRTVRIAAIKNKQNDTRAI